MHTGVRAMPSAIALGGHSRSTHAYRTTSHETPTTEVARGDPAHKSDAACAGAREGCASLTIVNTLFRTGNSSVRSTSKFDGDGVFPIQVSLTSSPGCGSSLMPLLIKYEVVHHSIQPSMEAKMKEAF